MAALPSLWRTIDNGDGSTAFGKLFRRNHSGGTQSYDENSVVG